VRISSTKILRELLAYIAQRITRFLFSPHLMTLKRCALVSLSSSHLSLQLWIVSKMASCKDPSGCGRSTVFDVIETLSSMPLIIILRLVEPIYIDDDVMLLGAVGILCNSLVAGRIIYSCLDFLARRVLGLLNAGLRDRMLAFVSVIAWITVVVMLDRQIRLLYSSIILALLAALIVHASIRILEELAGRCRRWL
jgi:hypothetical protein